MSVPSRLLKKSRCFQASFGLIVIERACENYFDIIFVSFEFLYAFI